MSPAAGERTTMHEEPPLHTRRALLCGGAALALGGCTPRGDGPLRFWAMGREG